MPARFCTNEGFAAAGTSLAHRRAKKRPVRCLLEGLENRVLLSAVSWVGASGSWNTATNWSTNTLPQPGDTVVISKAGAIQVTLTGSTSISSLSITGDTLTVSGGTLSVATTVSNSGSITVNPGAVLSVAGAYTEAASSVLTLPSGTLTSGVGANLLSNPGFESPSSGNGVEPNGWGNWGPSNISTTYAHSGLQSVQTPGVSGGSGVNGSFGVTPGVSYYLSVYAMTPSTAKLTGTEEGILNLIFYNASGTQVGYDGITILTASSATGGPISGSVGGQGWNFYSTSGVAPAGAVTAYIALQEGPYNGSGAGAGSVFWDDAQFGPTAATSAVVNAGSISNSGAITVGPAAKINATSAFSQTSTGTLNVQLGGSPAALLFGSVTTGGAATLAGVLDVTAVNGYSPAINDSFTILNYASETGGFSTQSLPSGASYAFQSAFNPTYFGISALPTSMTTTVNAGSVISTATSNLVGVNLAYWDDQLNTAQTASMVEAAGLSLFRFPGGSGSDDFHFNSDNNYNDPGLNTIPQFAQDVDNFGGVGIVTTDYGSGSAQEAEAELAYLLGSPADSTTIGTGAEWNDSTSSWQNVNWQTVGYWASLRAASPLGTDDGYNFLRIGRANPFTGINYWEIGNEQYGTWETDHYSPTGFGNNTTTSGGYNYPAAYAQFAATFSAFVKADKLLPAILVGIDSGDPTGASDNNWTKNVLTDGLADGFVPGFISDHSYMYGPGSENDSVLLNDTVSNPSSNLDWSTRYADYETTLQQTLGSSASSVHIMATEYNSNYGTEGKQMVSLVNGLFVADSIGSLLDSGYTGGVFWDLRNGWTTNGNTSATLYGWRQGGDEGILGDPNLNDPPVTGPYIAYPNYFGEQLASKIMQTGGVGVSASSSYSEFSTYAVLEPNGHLEILVINKNPDASLPEQFNISGFTPNGQATFWQYGEAQDYAQSQSGNGAASLANFSTILALSGNNFTYSFPAYSMTVIDLTPTLTLAAAAAANPATLIGASTALSALGAENGSSTGLNYTWSATGPASVTYTGATNGTNAAKNITANFSQPGIYNFTVNITDASGQSVGSSVQVTVLPVFASETGSTLTVNLNNIAPITIATSGSNVTVTESGYQLTFGSVTAITVNGSATNNVLNFNGPLAQPFSFTAGATTTLNVRAGTLNIGSASAITLGTVNIAGGASVMMPTASGSESQLTLAALSIAAGGVFNLNNNRLYINYGGGTDPISSVAAYISSGYNNGSWNGPTGITSSAAAANPNTYGLGYADSADPGNPAGLASGQIEVMYTLLGDANLDGKVNGTDFNILSANFNTGGDSWDQGDFNYDGKVNGTDFNFLAANFNQGVTIPAAAAVTIVSATTTTNSPSHKVAAVKHKVKHGSEKA